MKIHLVDGTYELFRAYFAQPSRQAPDGREVGAVRGLMQTLLALLRQEDVTHVAIAFDHVVESFRNELFAGYKTGEGTPEDLRAQFDLAERASQALGLVVWPMIEFEADDALASAAHRWGDDPAVEQVVICTPDKDLAQMVRGQRVVCLDRRREQTLDEAGVHLKFGVAPASIPDYLALVGDAADGIPGIPRWGAKSSGAVLARYHHLEQIPDDAIYWDVKVRGATAIAASLAERREEAKLYRELATLRLDVPLAESLDQLEWKGVRQPDFEELCAELGFSGLLVPKPPDSVPN
ncbi:MAG: flap endonuclease [Chloroflexi bacterium]|nr:flap endonuclease [Chloroflexota bacterium]